MNLLAIDTSNQVLGIAILKDAEIIGKVVTNISKNHSVRLMPAVEKLMKEVGMTPDELDKIAVAKGPGSFTGVRIGLSTAKSMAWALDIPVVGISSLEVLAYQGRFSEKYICPFFDARRGLVYTGIYQWQKGKLQTIYPEKNQLMQNVLEELAEEKREVLFLSPDISRHRDAIKDTIGEYALIPESVYHMADPGHLGLAGMHAENEYAHTLTPNYLRLAEAEAKWLQAQKENHNE